ncbi:MAG: hypothetical protein FWD71_23355 [Oscillospiraceae bacterium]|nr:hypothetical protein [Oscillospiraceae bacterium]
MNKEWLLENAGYPIKYSLTQEQSYIAPMLENEEVKAWLGRLTDRVMCNDLSNIHGSHDYRYENIVGKCFILGLNAKVPPFDLGIRFFIDFLDKHIPNTYDDKLTFGKMYQYRDYETILACYMPFLGYSQEKSVQYVANKRADIIYGFTKQNRYDVYRTDLAYPGAKKEWKPYIIDPELYKDGNIALPSIHDLILFAGMYPHFEQKTKDKVETTVRWIFDDRYSQINYRLFYYAPDNPSYKSKAINARINLSYDPQSLLYRCFIFSHFEEARKTKWFSKAMDYLKSYKPETGRYVFPNEMIAEQKDSYVNNGGHMNVGESKRSRDYAEIISTYWMEEIFANLC